MASSDNTQKTIYTYRPHDTVRICPFCDGENSTEAETCVICQRELEMGRIVSPEFTLHEDAVQSKSSPTSTVPGFKPRSSSVTPVREISEPVEEPSPLRIWKYLGVGLIILLIIVIPVIPVINSIQESAQYQNTYSFGNDYSDSDSKEYGIEDHYENGIRFLESGNYDNAINELKLVGEYKDAKEKLNWLYITQGDTAVANEQFDKALEYYGLASEGSVKPEQISYVKYNLGMKAYNEQRYSDALKLFSEIDGYKNVSEWIEATYYLYASQLIERGEYEEAVRKLELYDTDNFKALRKEAKYLYVNAHKNNTDTLTYSYLTELKNAKYKDSAKIYKNLYAWHVKVIGANYSYNSTKKLSKVSDRKTVYFHIRITGGPPDGSLKITKYKVHWPGKYGYWKTYKNKYPEYYSGDTDCFGFYWKKPGKYNAGKMKIKFYNNKGKLVASGSVKVVH